MLMSRPSVGEIIPISQVLRYWGNLGKLDLNTPNHLQRQMNVIQSLKFLVSHQMRHYSTVRALCGLSYTCFTVTWVLGEFGETGPKYPISCAGTHEKLSKVFSSTFYIKLASTLVSKSSKR